ncbi:acyloxyacyl hydrolase [Sphingomonas sp. BIUV-7]|uniref:Acyloxyacyl hydrolase n=1 Tax=Sphingomonas natans TaxID=3063330 RepID=A0ABT8Y5I1_9SPHN|nr:acyloxyacyl hydrolase [Sphingomonas sp. BIUV-7]MDO6413262.1 acyloxyacyl hydrolase [Sphingomonas sp. BIUV-7]
MDRVSGSFVIIVACVPFPARAQSEPLRPGAEIAIGWLDHGIRKPFRSAPPPGFIYEGEEERHTADLQFVYRSAPLTVALKPRLTARLQLNTAGRTSFASLGAEWRQHLLNDRVYAQTGIGLTIHDGYRMTPDPFAPGLSDAEAARRYRLYSRRTSFGSRVLFNPSLSLGVRLDTRWAIEAAFEHFSHAQLFGKQNPGINTIGLRLVHALGR